MVFKWSHILFNLVVKTIYFQFDKFTNLPPRVLTDSSGSLVIMTGANPVLFGVGTDAASYTPVTITNNGTDDYFSVNVKNGVYSKGTSGNPVILQAVNKTWNISKLNPDGGNATITPTLTEGRK